MKMSKLTQKKNRKAEEEEELVQKTGERVSGEPDSNLAAVGGGGIAGAAAGGAIGTAVGGPIGGVIGAVAGGVAGAAAGESIADEIDPKIEETYWRKNYHTRPYYREHRKFEDYLPAYRLGWEIAAQAEHRKREFEQSEHELRNRWQVVRQDSSLEWEEVRHAMKDAFDRIRKANRVLKEKK
jgi:hypothetical protein